MRIYTGVDIVYVPRFKEKILKFSNNADFDNPFIKRLFSEEEILHIVDRPNPYLGLAGRFAAKEAIIKALAPIKKLVNYKEILIIGEKPSLKSPIFKNIQVSVSISHDKDYAVANATVLQI